MAAVLLDAIHTLVRTRSASSNHARKQLAEVACWFEDADDSWPFSFVSICAALDLDAGAIRARLR